MEDDNATPTFVHPRPREPRYKLSGPKTRGTAYSDASYRVLQQCHPGLVIMVPAIDIMNAFLNDMFERVAREASRLRRRSDAALTRSEIETATRLVLPGGVGEFAVNEAQKYFTPPPANRRKLEFPAATIARWLRKGKYAPRVCGEAGLYLAVVLDSLAFDVLELAGDEAKQADSEFITPYHVMLAFRLDEELDCLVSSRTLCPSERRLFVNALRLNAIDASPRTLFPVEGSAPGTTQTFGSGPYLKAWPSEEFQTLFCQEIFD